MPSPLSSTSSSFLFFSSHPPPSAVILIRRERSAKELQLVVAGHLPPVEIEMRRQIKDNAHVRKNRFTVEFYLR